MVRLLRELIAIPSINPAFAAAGDPRAGEGQMVEFLAEIGRKAGLTVARIPVAKGRHNLLVRLKPKSKPKARVLLAPHLDTVVAGDEMLKPRVRGDRIYGRGACDTKGCVAAMFSALLTMAHSANRPRHTEIVFVGLADEEYAQEGSRALARSGLRADLGIVGEPTRLRVVTAHKGDYWLQLETRGKAAHGSSPHLGKNAVHEMARVVDVLETRYAAQLKKKRHPLLGHPTINVGVMQGGRQPNIVPDRCQIHIDRRSLPGETMSGVIREIKSLLKEKGLRASFVDLRGRPTPALETSPGLPMVQQFTRSVGAKQTYGVDYFCDAAVLASGGIPCIVFGPGDIAQAHTTDEWISIQSLVRGELLLTRFLQSLS